MTKQATPATSKDRVDEFLREVERFCDDHGISVNYLSHRALRNTYAIRTLARQRRRADEVIEKVTAAMDEIRTARQRRAG